MNFILDDNIPDSDKCGMSALQTYLVEAGIRQDDFAASVGVTQATISKLVRGVARPSLDLAFAIERATLGRVPVQTWDVRSAMATDAHASTSTLNQEPSHDNPHANTAPDAA